MKIKRLQLHNFGIYAGDNTFEFSLKKPVVLIGGMNGRGKTTFLEAIVLSLYGSNSVMYKESGYKTYGQYLRSLVNRDSWTQRSFVELTFVENDEGTLNEYTVHRDWDANGKRTAETIDVSKNGVYSDFLTSNWSMFVENIVPSALSSFYFFDGEKIAELALDESNSQLRESIRAMLGLNILDTLKNDLHKSLKRRSRQQTPSASRDMIQNLKQQQDSLIQSVADKEREIQELQLIVKNLQGEIDLLQANYWSKGGRVIEQRVALIQKKAELKVSLEEVQSDLLSIAAGVLPLRMVKDYIQDIKLQAEDEHDELVMRQLIERIDGLLLDYLSQEDHGEKECQAFIDYIKHQYEAESSTPIYQVSEFTLFQLNNLLDGLFDNTRKHTLETMDRKRKLQNQLNEIESYLSLDINEEEMSRITATLKKKQEELVSVQVKLSNTEKELDDLKTSLYNKNIEVKKAVESYLSEASSNDENSRMEKYTHMALRLLDIYSVEVQSQKSDILASTITECYHKLASKQRLIDCVTVNPVSLEIAYLDHDQRRISSNMLSAGEKQLMVISALWALAICSKKKLPVIIDTPLSRLDSAHRASVVQTYFPDASNQTIILSTDSEIDRTYYALIKDSVGDEYTLLYDEDLRSTTIRKGYFES